MKMSYLFPNQCKKWGWVLFVPGLLLGTYAILFNFEIPFLKAKAFALISQGIFEDTGYFKLVENNYTDELVGLLLIIGGILVAFSKEKDEDEYIARVRLDSLVWATYVNYGVLFLSIIFLYGLVFSWVMILNLFTILIFFIIRFNWVLYKTRRSVKDEEQYQD